MVLVAWEYGIPILSKSISNTLKLPNGIFDAMTSKLSFSNVWLSIVSKPSMTTWVSSANADNTSPVIKSFSKAVFLVSCMATGRKPPTPADGSRKVFICKPCPVKVC